MDLKIHVRSVGSDASGHFWQAGDGICETNSRYGEFHAPDEKPSTVKITLVGLAVTEDHYLVVGTLKPAGILIFDLHAGGAPRHILWDADIPFVPFDMAARPGGGVFILDRTYQSVLGA